MLDRPRVMGIVNVTPDSFSDGGRYEGAAGVAHGLGLVAEGADALDVGGESTRPGAAGVDAEVQIARVVPVIEGLRGAGCGALISVDTTRSSVASAALAAGADAVNDVSGGTDDPEMLGVIAACGAGVVLMHRRARPSAEVYSTQYADAPAYEGGVVEEVRRVLGDRVSAAASGGIARESIVIDPGLGFGKTPAQNYALARAAGEFAGLGCPVLGGASRKSFVGHAAGIEEPDARDAASVGVAVVMLMHGVRVFRVHAVGMHREALSAAWAAMGVDEGME